MIELFILITTDPAIAWKILANVYSTQTIADVMKTLNKWENLRMMDGMMVSVFVKYVYNLKQFERNQ